jgi:hypothetical protein
MLPSMQSSIVTDSLFDRQSNQEHENTFFRPFTI